MTTTWTYTEYKAWLDIGCPPDNTVTRLSLYNNNLATIPPKITQLRNLTHLSFTSNYLTTIPPEITQLQNLTILSLNGNNLAVIPPEIGKLRNLTYLWLHNNNLTVLPPEITQLPNLTHLWLHNNNLTTILPEITQLQNLTDLWLHNNNLTTIPPEIGQLRNLTSLSLYNNPIEHIPFNVARILARQRTLEGGVYADTQSVHNSTIQETLRESMMRLLNEKIREKDIIPLILQDPVLTPFTKESLVEYSRDEDIHTVLNVTFSDVLIMVWNRIMVSPHSDEIKSVLNTEMTDAECKCFTGRISRLVNCLNGFDPLVVIRISDNEQIGNVILTVKRKLEEKNEYTVEKHKEELQTRLEELGVEADEIKVWLSHIEE